MVFIGRGESPRWRSVEQGTFVPDLDSFREHRRWPIVVARLPANVGAGLASIIVELYELDRTRRDEGRPDSEPERRSVMTNQK